MEKTLPALKYTLCFCLHRGDVLLLFRAKQPYINHWNGVGGKIEPGESPLHCAKRETLEETGIDTDQAHCRELGFVTWHQKDTPPEAALQVFFFILPDTWTRPFESLDTREGKLQWHALDFVTDRTNTTIVENIPYFFADMQSSQELLWYDFGFDANQRIAEYRVEAAPRGILRT